MTLQGLDLSNWQGTADWDAITGAGYQFAIIKASEGVTFTDPQFARNWSECKRVGMGRLAYHYAHPELNQPTPEWLFHKSVIDSVGGYQTGDGDALDMESQAVAAGVNLAPWCVSYLGNNQSFRMGLYSGNWYMQPHGLESDPTLAQYPLWYASWQGSEPPPPPGWPSVTIWQNAAGVAVPGASGADTDVFYGSAVQLAALGMPPPAKVPWDDPARLQTIGYICGGSGPADLIAWLGQYQQ